MFLAFMKRKTFRDYCSVGGQTPLNIAEFGKSRSKNFRYSQVIDLAEDRDRFRHMMEKLGMQC